MIWTANSANPRAEALAIAGDRLLAVGTEAEVRASAGPSTRIVDLRGCFVTPGFQDAHAHFPGPPLNRVDLAGAESLEEFQRRVAEYARTHPEDAWIVGDGWGNGIFPDKIAHRRHLDAVVSEAKSSGQYFIFAVRTDSSAPAPSRLPAAISPT